MTKVQWLVLLGWFLLAVFVMYRCFTVDIDVHYDVLFAAWCGGVLSYACVEIIVRRRREAL